MKKSARRQSRELATQGLYQWLLSNAPSGEIDAQLRGALGYDKADKELLEAILHGVIREHATLVEALTPSLDRPIDQLSPVERAEATAATSSSGTRSPTTSDTTTYQTQPHGRTHGKLPACPAPDATKPT